MDMKDEEMSDVDGQQQDRLRSSASPAFDAKFEEMVKDVRANEAVGKFTVFHGELLSKMQEYDMRACSDRFKHHNPAFTAPPGEDLRVFCNGDHFVAQRYERIVTSGHGAYLAIAIAVAKEFCARIVPEKTMDVVAMSHGFSQFVDPISRVAVYYIGTHSDLKAALSRLASSRRAAAAAAAATDAAAAAAAAAIVDAAPASESQGGKVVAASAETLSAEEQPSTDANSLEEKDRAHEQAELAAEIVDDSNEEDDDDDDDDGEVDGDGEMSRTKKRLPTMLELLGVTAVITASRRGGGRCPASDSEHAAALGAPLPTEEQVAAAERAMASVFIAPKTRQRDIFKFLPKSANFTMDPEAVALIAKAKQEEEERKKNGTPKPTKEFKGRKGGRCKGKASAASGGKSIAAFFSKSAAAPAVAPAPLAADQGDSPDLSQVQPPDGGGGGGGGGGDHDDVRLARREVAGSEDAPSRATNRLPVDSNAAPLAASRDCESEDCEGPDSKRQKTAAPATARTVRVGTAAAAASSAPGANPIAKKSVKTVAKVFNDPGMIYISCKFAKLAPRAVDSAKREDRCK
jgi:hypothetical protein